MDIIKSPNSGLNKYDEYEALLLERDQLSKEAGQIWTAYVQTFGQLMTDVYEEKIECIKARKTIAFYQRALNHGGVVDQEALESWLTKEMSAYYANLKKLQEDYGKCKDAPSSTPYEVQRSKTLYRRLAKRIHPDIFPETDRQENLKELWQRILTAYAHNDVRALSELEVLVRKVLKDLGSPGINIDIPDIEDRIDSLKAEIDDIIHSEPYTYGSLLEDEEAVEKKKTELQKELEDYRKYHAELKDAIMQMVTKGGIEIKWRMN